MENVADDQEILEWISKPETHEKGFRSLMDKYKEKMYWHVRRMVLNHDDADDVLQNTFIKVFRSIDQFEQKSSLYTWLYRIATNETLTFLNRNKKWQYDSLDNFDEHPAIASLKADSYFNGDEVQLKLEKALLMLPEKQKLVFQMRYYDEMSYKDISASLDTSEGALKASFHHAIKKLEDYFKTNQ
ncbi:MAG: RNA polymerase sigma factor [Bacteroidota bacterium]|nr:RNA polymerase sigma factor [Bacteroidota bacterium]